MILSLGDKTGHHSAFQSSYYFGECKSFDFFPLHGKYLTKKSKTKKQTNKKKNPKKHTHTPKKKKATKEPLINRKFLRYFMFSVANQYTLECVGHRCQTAELTILL